MHKTGYTLFEMLVVLALLGLLMSFSLVITMHSHARLVFYDVNRLYAAFLYMQRTAMLEQRVKCITFQKNERTYLADKMHALSTGVEWGSPLNAYGPPSRPIGALEDPIVWPQATVTFYPDGTISSGAVYMTDSKKSCCYALTCDASECSRIRRYRYAQRHWELIKD